MLRRNLRILKYGQYLWGSKFLQLHTSALPVLYSRNDKDLPNPIYPTPVSKLYGPDTDILLNQLKSCNSIDRLLEVINMHLDVMNSKHIMACLENIYSCIKDDTAVGQSLIENPIFKSFCARLMKIVRLLEAHDLLVTYKTFCALEVRNNTYLMQCILKMIGAHLNNMTIGQLTFLNYLLYKQRHNPLIDGLRLALPLVLQVQIDQQLDSDNLKEVVNCLQLSCRSALKPATIQKIVDVVKQKASFLTTEEAITVIYSLLHTDTPIDGYSGLIDIAFEIVSKNAEEISPSKLCAVLRTCRFKRFYHVKFFYTVADFIVSQKWNLELTISALSHMYLVGFYSPTLLDHFCEVLCLESKLYQDTEAYTPLNCIEYLTATSYRPPKVDEAARVLYSDEKKLENFRLKSPHLFLKFLSCLAMLGHFPRDSLNKLINEDDLLSVLTFCKKLGRISEFDRYLLALHWSLQLNDEAKNFTIPPTILKKVIHIVFQKNLNAEYPLTNFFENGLGGPQFLRSGVFTDDGHVIDHIVAMRSGNYPVSLQNLKTKGRKEASLQNATFVDDIMLPDDAKIIAVLVGQENDYFRDPEMLKGWVDLKVRSLTKRNYAVVVVNYNVWMELPDREKIPYLMREIKQVMNDDCVKRSNYS